jgi:hypothetical protein
MTLPLPSNARRRLRRPSRATILAFVVLSVLATALVGAPAGMAQELDPLAAVDQAMDGGSMSVPTDLETGIEEAIEAGGVPAVLESPQEPVPSPVPSLPPAPEPQSEVPPAPDTGTPSETAPGPAPESAPTDSVVEDANPGAPVAPINLNVDIRILSPGDNGDVTQEMTVPGWSGPVGGGAQGQPLAWTWNWTWNWTTPAGGEAPGMGIGEELVGEVLGTQPLGDPGQFFADAPVEQPAETEPQPVGLAPGADHPPPARSDATAPGRLGAKQWSSGGSQLHSLPTVVGPSDGAASVVTAAARATSSRRDPDRGNAPAPKQAPPALPSAAASSAGGGSSAPFAAAILALLCLLAPRMLELARSPHRKLSSQLSSSRLERPG